MSDLSTFVSTALVPLRKSAPPARQLPANGAPVVVNNSLISDLRVALRYLDADPYDEWISTGLSLKTTGEPGRELWLEWSATSKKYNKTEAEKKWESFYPTNTSYKAIFAAAQLKGWSNPGYSRELLPVTEALKANIEAQLRGMPPNESRYRLLADADFESMPPAEYRVKGVFPAHANVSIFGPSGGGKSFVAFDCACAIAEGRDWFGNRVKPAPVLYVVLEGEASFSTRIKAWKRHNGRPLPEGLRVIMQPFRLTDPRDVNDLAAIVPKGCVIFIDTLNRAAPTADENSSKDMGAIIEGAKTLQQLTGGLVVLIAHTGKDETKRIRGHSSLIAALDAAIYITREKDTRCWIIDKCKDGIDGLQHNFQLKVVDVGVDEDGEAITSCVVVPDSRIDLPGREKPLTANQQLGMTSFNEAASQIECLDGKGNFAGVRLENWRSVFYRISTADNQNAKMKAFQRARHDLVELKRLVVNNDVYRLAGPFARVTERCIEEGLKTTVDTRWTK